MTLPYYLKSGSFALAGRIFAALALLIEIGILNHLLGKTHYGDFVYAHTMIMMLAMILGNTVRSFILYRFSKETDPFHNPYYQTIFTTTITISTIIMGIIMMFGWTSWLVLLPFIIPLDTMRVALIAGLQAQQKIISMIFYNVILPYGLRLVCLCSLMIFPFHDITIGIILAYVTALGLPIIILIGRYRIIPSITFRLLTKTDLSYTAKLMATQILHQSTRFIDMIIIGFFATGAVIADYAVAFKFAVFLALGKEMLQSLLTPRLAKKNKTMVSEYNATRVFGIVIAVCGLIGFGIIHPLVLPLFGDYHGVVPLFYIIGSGILARVMTGCTSEFLTMHGHAGWVLLSTALTLIITAVIAFFSFPVFGIWGCALAVLCGGIISCISLLYAAWKTEKFIAINVTDCLFCTAVIGMSLSMAFDLFSLSSGLLSLSVLLGVYLYTYRAYMIKIKNMV